MESVLDSDHRIWSIALSFALLQGMLLTAALLLRRSGRRRPRLFLAGALAGNSAVLLFWFLLSIDGFRAFPLSHALARFATWTLSPLIYFYLRTLLDDAYRPRAWAVVLVVAAPGLLRLVRDLWHGYDLEAIAGYLDLALANDILPGAAPGFVIFFLRTAYQFVFAVLSLRLILGAWQSRRAGDLELGLGHLAWLTTLGVLIAAFNISHLQGAIAGTRAHGLPLGSAYALSLLRSAIVPAAAFMAMIAPDTVDRTVGRISRARRRVRLQDDIAQKHLDKLMAYMEEEAPYRDTELRVAKLGAALDMPAHLLSQLLNEKLQTGFTDFVNGYRVSEAQRLLRSDKARHYTLSAIGEEAGFASRASFNRVFKSTAGMTPSAYRDGGSSRPPLASTPRDPEACSR